MTEKFKTYLETIALANGLEKNVQWMFYPGMLQDSRAKWWDDFLTRHAYHEGIDICFHRDPAQKEMKFHWGLKVPAFDRGTILNICKDFLGQSLIVEHDGYENLPLRVVFVYSHIDPEPGLSPGSRIQKGQIIARVSDTRPQKSKLISHLHLSCIELGRDIAFEQLNWDLFPSRDQVNLINPVFI